MLRKMLPIVGVFSFLLCAALVWGAYELDRVLGPLGKVVYDLPKRPPTDLEVKFRNLLKDFAQSSEPTRRVAFTQLLPRPLRKICEQRSRGETQDQFEQETGEDITGYHTINDQLGYAYWFFYQDGSYEPVYVGDAQFGYIDIYKPYSDQTRRCFATDYMIFDRRMAFEDDEHQKFFPTLTFAKE